MPCPEPAGFSALKAEGIDLVVSLLDAKDMAELGMEDEAGLCERNAMAFAHHPIVDFGLPDLHAFHKLVSVIKIKLDAGANTAIHCRAGIGRSGVTICALLVLAGCTGDDAIKIGGQARGEPIPDTQEQAGFIRIFAEHFRPRS